MPEMDDGTERCSVAPRSRSLAAWGAGPEARVRATEQRGLQLSAPAPRPNVTNPMRDAGGLKQPRSGPNRVGAPGRRIGRRSRPGGDLPRGDPRCSEPDALASAYAPNAERGLTRSNPNPGSAPDTPMPICRDAFASASIVRC